MSESSSATTPAQVWALPKSLTDPRPVVIACVLGWIVTIVVTLILAGPDSPILPTCYAGLGIGAIGIGIFLLQRTAARRGTKGAQRAAGL